MKTLILDNYDSFTFNLYQLIWEVNGEEPLVVKNDQYHWSELRSMSFDNLVISPGPGRPDNKRDFGVCHTALMEAGVPVLGVCLGHQGLAVACGGAVIHAPEVMHGRLSNIYHQESELFEGIPQGFQVVRYHSLMVGSDLPPSLEKIAWTLDGIIMGLRHLERPLWSVQFHPESICTEYGRCLLENFRDITLRFHKNGNKSKSCVSVPNAYVPRDRPVPAAENGFQIHYSELPAFCDPEEVFCHLFREEPVAFWLDSSRVEPGLSRFSFMGAAGGPFSALVEYNTDAEEVTVNQNGTQRRSNQSIFDHLDRELKRLRVESNDLPFEFNCGFVGYFGYELKKECGATAKHHYGPADAEFLFADRIIAFDLLEKRTYLLCLEEKGRSARAEDWLRETARKLKDLPPLPQNGAAEISAPITFRLNRPHQTYLSDIDFCRQHITEGETYEICLTNQICANLSVNAFDLYRNLRRINPAPYAAYLRFNDFHILSSSPERFLRLDANGWVESKPIKGTRPRGGTPEDDERIREELLSSQKDQAENLMIVDLVRNDLGRVCDVGTVHVPKLMAVESYETVHQLVSTIRGRLRDGCNIIDCVRCCFPGGSMTGAPKLRTMEILDQFEQEARGVYSGALGFLALNGAADLNIVIRTIVMSPACTNIGAGGAIVALSDPESEFQEMLLKAKALIHAIALTAHGRFEQSEYRSFEEQITRKGFAILK